MAVITTLGVPDNSGNTTTIMPKLQYRFRVTFVGEGFSATPTRSGISTYRPSLAHDEIPLDSYNSRIYLAGKHTWVPISLNLREDVNNNVQKLVGEQLQ